MRKFIYIHRVAVLAAALAVPGLGHCGRLAAMEAASPWAGPDSGKARLIAARDGADGGLDIGVQIVLAPGWKTYWRSPGDAGLPPEFDWTGSNGAAAPALYWPAPHRLDQAGLESFVYEDEVVFPARVAAPVGQPLRLRLKLSYGVCKDICIPAEAELALDLPAGGGRPTPFADLIARYAAKVPRPASEDDVRFLGVTLAGADALAIEVETGTPFRAPDLIVEGPSPYWFGKPQTALVPGGRRASFRVPVGGGRDLAALKDAMLTLTLIDGGRAVEEKRAIGR